MTSKIVILTQEECDIILQNLPLDPPTKGLGPMFYSTLTYEGDLKLFEKIKKIEGKLNEA